MSWNIEWDLSLPNNLQKSLKSSQSRTIKEVLEETMKYDAIIILNTITKSATVKPPRYAQTCNCCQGTGLA